MIHSYKEDPFAEQQSPFTYLAPTDPAQQAARARAPQRVVGFPAPSGAPLPATVPFANDLSLEIPLPSTERRVSPAGWSSWRFFPSPHIPDSVHGL